MIIKQIFTEPETEVKWYFDSIEEIAIVYIRNRLRGTFACACNTLRLRRRLVSFEYGTLSTFTIFVPRRSS